MGRGAPPGPARSGRPGRAAGPADARAAHGFSAPDSRPRGR